MSHVSLHNTIVTPWRMPAHTRLLGNAPPYNRLSALVCGKGTYNQCPHFICRAEVNILMEKHLLMLHNYPSHWRASDGCCLTSPINTVSETMRTDDCDIRSGSYEMSSTAITITKFNGTFYAQSAIEMALLLEQKTVYGIIKGYDDKPAEPAANATAREKAAFKDWMNRHGVGRSSILLGMDLSIQAEYTVIDYAKTLLETLASTYKSKLKLNIFEIREDHWSIRLQDCGDVDNYASWINWKVKDYHLCTGPTAPSTTDTDAADMDSAKTIARMSEQDHIFYLLLGIPRNNEWKGFMELVMDNNAMMTTMPDELVIKLVYKEAAMERDIALAPEALLFAKTGGNVGNGSKGGKGGKSPKRDERENEGDNNRKENDLRKCFHCQQRRHITENCLSKQRGDPRNAADTAAQHRLKRLWLTPLWSTTLGWRLAQMRHAVIGSLSADARLTSPAVDQCLSPTLNIPCIWRKWRDTMGSHPLHPDMEVLGWLVNCQIEWRKQSYFKKWCICEDCSTSSHSLRSCTGMSKSNRWTTAVSTSTIAMANWLPLHLRSMGYVLWIRLWNRPNTLISPMTAACWHFRRLRMHLSMMQRRGCYGTTAWHTSVSKRWRSCRWSPMLREWLGSAIERVASSAG